MSPRARRNSHRDQSMSGAPDVSPAIRPRTAERDATVVGSGPNGLAAAIVLARSGWSVSVREASDVAGGAVRSKALTLPGYLHDVGSAVHPLAVSSPLFNSLPLAAHGLQWVHPPVVLAHPVDEGPAVLLHRSIDETAVGLGAADGRRYRQLMAPLVENWDALCEDILAPQFPMRWPRHPLLFARFAAPAALPATAMTKGLFAGERARALLGGLAAHSILPLTWPGSAAFALVLGTAGHAVGWPFPRGGSGSLARALVGYLETLGGTVVTGTPVRSLGEIRGSRATLLDLTPRQVVAVANEVLSRRQRAAFMRYRYGPAAFKVDWALSAPIPWRDPQVALAATVHVAGTLAEMTSAEAAPWRGAHAERPFVLLVQPSLFDPSRAPPGRHTAWAYCHVPNGSATDMLPRIEAQIERFAPGFREVVLARVSTTPSQLEAFDANLVGGDIAGGANTLWQLLFRPTVRRVAYETGVPGLYLCSSSTPPGGGVHGMCGYHAAQAVLAAEGP